jgi:hypothetical protein
LGKDQAISDNVDEENPPRKRRKLASSTEDIPRLITVVEIVKREYSKALSKKASETSPIPATLHQYNYLGCLPTDRGFEEQDELLVALEGKNQYVPFCEEG